MRKASGWNSTLTNTGFQAGGVKREMNTSRLNGLQFRRKLRLRITRAQPLQGEAGHFARIFQIKLVFNVRSVGLHRFGAEM
jgi:hypothetical protein